uniref:Uncharacterized protein n=1 Tax=Amphimedon queenslandica TaxID=400682 RepID=A0A1X7VMT9_AMPQE
MDVAAAATELCFRFLCGLRGYHVYKRDWIPILNEVLKAEHEENNLYDRYAIADKKKLPGQAQESIVGHLPKEVSRLTRFIILHGATVTAKVTVKMVHNETNEALMAKYKELVACSYKEPVDGKFEDITDMILGQLNESSSEEESDVNTD